jgi:signal transduction histidine kinase
MNPRRPWVPYLVAVLGTVGILTLMSVGGPKLVQITGYLPLMVSVVLAAWVGGLGPGLLATGLGLGGALLFLPNPLGHVPLPSAQVALMLVRSVVLGLLVSVILETLHRTRRRLERERAQLQSEIRRRDEAENLVRHLNEDLCRREESLLVADRRKDEFLATLAHELRNPLAPLLNGLHLIRLGGSDPALVAQSREMMERALELERNQKLQEVAAADLGLLALIEAEFGFCVRARLDVAREWGVSHAAYTCGPGSISERNAMRWGLTPIAERTLYSR